MLLKNVNYPEIRSNVARYAKDLSEEEIILIANDESMAVTMWLAEKEDVVLNPEVQNKILFCIDVMPKILLIRSGKIKDIDLWDALLKDENDLVNAEACKYAPLAALEQLEYASKGTFLQKVKLSERVDLADNAAKILENSGNSYLNKVMEMRCKYNVVIESGFKANVMEKYVKYGENPSQPDIFSVEEIGLFENIVKDSGNFLFPVTITAFSRPQEFYDIEDQLADADYDFESRRMTILYSNGENSRYRLSYIDSLQALIYHELWHDQIMHLAKAELVALANAGGWHGYINRRLISPQNLKLKQLQGREAISWARLDRNGKIREEFGEQGQEFIEYIVDVLTEISMYPKLGIDTDEPLLQTLTGIFENRKKRHKGIVDETTQLLSDLTQLRTSL
jgi:hypothetical protein